MVRDNNRLANYVWITRHVVIYMIQNLRQIVNDANTEAEDGFLDQMNPELPQYQWMGAIIRYLNTVRAILEHQSELPLDLITNIIEDEEI